MGAPGDAQRLVVYAFDPGNEGGTEMQASGAPGATLNLTEVMDNCRIGSLQIRVFVLCLGSLIMDGFDVQAMGYVAPAMLGEWNLPRPTLGPLLSIGHLGVMFGAIAFIPLFVQGVMGATATQAARANRSRPRTTGSAKRSCLLVTMPQGRPAASRR